MSIYTKKAIMDSFVKMLSQKSFDKITIKDIIEDCGLNRSTFYYYYEDIYALLEDVLQTELERITGKQVAYSLRLDFWKVASSFWKIKEQCTTSTILSDVSPWRSTYIR